MNGQKKVIRYRGRPIGEFVLAGVWLLSLVIAAGLFLYAGDWLDSWLGTAHYFMFGLCLLAIITTAGSFFEDRSARRTPPFRSFTIGERFVLLIGPPRKRPSR